MDGVSASGALLKSIASYGVLGLGWIAWMLTMVYLQAERKRYQALVIHIIKHFTQVAGSERVTPKELLTDEPESPKGKDRHRHTFRRLFGTDLED